MIAFLKGVLIEAFPNFIFLDVQGVGYKVHTPAQLLAKLPEPGKPLLIHTSLIIRENSQALYGFIESAERDLFEILVEQVTGVGPKLALSIVSHLPIADLQSAVSRGDAAVISRVPGVGKKTAERLIVEMRDKLFDRLPKAPSSWAVKLPADPKTRAHQDMLGALLNLGYSLQRAQNAAEKALEETKDYNNLPQLITKALHHLK